MAITRIKNNQVTDATAGNVYLGIDASTKLQDYSITPQKVANDFTYGSNWTISGNLTVNGQTTTIDTVSTVIEDPILLLAKDQTGAPSVDIGFIGERGSSENIAFVWDESADEFVTVFTNDTVTNTTVGINSYANFKGNDIVANGTLVVNGTSTLTGNVISNLNVSANLSAANIATPGLITALGNITGENLIANANVQTVEMNVSSLTANRVVFANTGGQLIDSQNFQYDGSIATIDGVLNVDNVTIDSTTISTNSTDANLTLNPNGTGWVILDGLNNQVTGNLFVEENLTVNGNLTYINIIDINVQDPIISLGRGANDAPLTTNDGKDRGTALWYYTGAEYEAFVGWDNSANLMFAAQQTSIANEVVTVNTWGTFKVGNMEAVTNAQVSGTLTTPNVTANTALSITSGSNGNITIDPNGSGVIILDNEVATGVVYLGSNKEIATNANLTYDTTDVQLLNGNLKVGDAVANVFVTNEGIQGTGRLIINQDSSDVDFTVNGDTVANIFYVDAGTGTASFGNATQTTNAVVAFNASNSVLLPVGNSAQRPATGVTGMVRFNTTLDSLEFYDADSWVSAGTVFTVIDSQVFNGDGSTVAYTLDSDQTTDSCIVSINGVVQIPVVAYSVSGNVMTFTEAPISQDVIEVRKITTTVTVKALSNSTGNAVVEVEDTNNNVSITGDLIPTANNTQSLGTTTNRWSEVFVAGGSITLGNIVLKNETGNTLAFYGPDGTTPGVLSSNNVDTTSISNGTASVQTFSASGNVGISAGGNANVLVVDAQGIHVTGNVAVSGNLIASQTLNVTSPLLYLTDDAPYPYNFSIGFYSNFTGGAGNTYQHSGLIRDYNDNVWKFSSNVAEPVGNVYSFTNAIYDQVKMGVIDINASGNATAILNSGGNGVGNIGNSSAYFNTAFVKATSAQYADLAENYEADAAYEPGTVVCFGGAKEVTVCNVADCTRVAGVISTNPSYLMNSGQSGEHVTAVALQGRVPCKVTGQIRKGDLIVSAGDGRGYANNEARAGTIIGKALADFDGQDGVIEVVVGRV